MATRQDRLGNDLGTLLNMHGVDVVSISIVNHESVLKPMGTTFITPVPVVVKHVACDVNVLEEQHAYTMVTTMVFVSARDYDLFVLYATIVTYTTSRDLDFHTRDINSALFQHLRVKKMRAVASVEATVTI